MFWSLFVCEVVGTLYCLGDLFRIVALRKSTSSAPFLPQTVSERRDQFTRIMHRVLMDVICCLLFPVMIVNEAIYIAFPETISITAIMVTLITVWTNLVVHKCCVEMHQWSTTW